MLEIILWNILFWSAYIWLCRIPYRVFQNMIDNA